MQDTLGRFVMTLLYHFKSIEHRLEWSKAIHKFQSKDKHTVNNSINKVKSAINDVVMIAKQQETVNAINNQLRSDEQIVLFMTLVEQLYELKIEELTEVTDLIDEYLKNKDDKQEILHNT